MPCRGHATSPACLDSRPTRPQSVSRDALMPPQQRWVGPPMFSVLQDKGPATPAGGREGFGTAAETLRGTCYARRVMKHWLSSGSAEARPRSPRTAPPADGTGGTDGTDGTDAPTERLEGVGGDRGVAETAGTSAAWLEQGTVRGLGRGPSRGSRTGRPSQPHSAYRDSLRSAVRSARFGPLRPHPGSLPNGPRSPRSDFS